MAHSCNTDCTGGRALFSRPPCLLSAAPSHLGEYRPADFLVPFIVAIDFSEHHGDSNGRRKAVFPHPLCRPSGKRSYESVIHDDSFSNEVGGEEQGIISKIREITIKTA